MEKILYYRHSNNEIYEMKLKNVVINLHNSVKMSGLGKYSVEYICADVAGLGELEYARITIGGNTLRPYNIYDTIEKAIRGYNTNTLSYKDRQNGLHNEDFFNVSFNGTGWDCSAFDLKFILPEHIFEEPHKGITGTCYAYSTWVWNGFEPIKKSYLGRIGGFKGAHHNSYGSLWYDLMTGECIYDKTIVGYATREECARANSVKVHRF